MALCLCVCVCVIARARACALMCVQTCILEFAENLESPQRLAASGLGGLRQQPPAVPGGKHRCSISQEIRQENSGEASARVCV